MYFLILLNYHKSKNYYVMRYISNALPPTLAIRNGDFSAHIATQSDLKVAEGNGKLQSTIK